MRTRLSWFPIACFSMRERKAQSCFGGAGWFLLRQHSSVQGFNYRTATCTCFFFMSIMIELQRSSSYYPLNFDTPQFILKKYTMRTVIECNEKSKVIFITTSSFISIFYTSTANYAQQLYFGRLHKTYFSHGVRLCVFCSAKKVQDDILRKSDQQFTLLLIYALEFCVCI